MMHVTLEEFLGSKSKPNVWTFIFHLRLKIEVLIWKVKKCLTEHLCRE